MAVCDSCGGKRYVCKDCLIYGCNCEEFDAPPYTEIECSECSATGEVKHNEGYMICESCDGNGYVCEECGEANCDCGIGEEVECAECGGEGEIEE